MLDSMNAENKTDQPMA